MKNTAMVLFLILSSFIANASVGLQDFSNRSIIFLIKVNEEGFKKHNIIKDQVFPAFKQLKKEQFPSENVHFLVKDISFFFGLASVFAKREIADDDILVRIDLHQALSDAQEQALLHLKNELRSISDRLVVFASKNYQFHKANDAKNSDIAMAFINRWHPSYTMQEAQSYWYHQHGPLVMETGLPPVIKSYTQIHTDIELGESDLFDLTYQGLSFETITSQEKFISFFLMNPSLRKLNEKLMKDELNFTPPPLLFVFKRWGL